MHGILDAGGKRLVLARHDGRRRQPPGDLLGVVGTDQDGGRARGGELRQPAAARGIEALGQDQQGCAVGQILQRAAKLAAGHGDPEQLAVGERARLERAGLNPSELELRQVPRVASVLCNGRRLEGISAGQRHLMPTLSEQRGERRAPGAAPDDCDLHPCGLPTKSMMTGTPASWNRSLRRFSTQ